MWFRVCHSLEDALLDRQLIRVTAFLLYRSLRKQKKLGEDTCTFRIKSRVNSSSSQVSEADLLDVVEVGVGESKQERFLSLSGGLAIWRGETILIRTVLNKCFSFLPNSGGLFLRVCCV